MQTANTEEQKRAAAVRAAEWIRDEMVVGLGTGSTVRHLLEEIAARRGRGELRGVVGVPTSRDTATRAGALGIPLRTLEECPRVDLTLDGADEVDPRLRLVKGLGGALLREKIVATASRELVVMVDESKVVERLGTRAPLPVEVDPFGTPIQIPFLRTLGAEPEVRRTDAGEAYRTDGGNLILDCRFAGGIADPEALEEALHRRVGIFESGLFLGMASAVVVAGAEGVRVLRREEVEG